MMVRHCPACRSQCRAYRALTAPQVVAILAMLVMTAMMSLSPTSANASAATAASPPPQSDIANPADYLAFRPATLLAWHPVNRRMLIQTRSAVGAAHPQLHIIDKPSGEAQLLPALPAQAREDVNSHVIKQAVFAPLDGDTLLVRATLAPNHHRVFRLHLKRQEWSALTPTTHDVSALAWTATGTKIAYASKLVGNSTNDVRTRIYLVNPLQVTSQKEILALDVSYICELLFTPDEKSLILLEDRGALGSRLWRIEIENGRATQLGAPDSTPAHYRQLQMNHDGSTLYALASALAQSTKVTTKLVRINLAGNLAVERADDSVKTETAAAQAPFATPLAPQLSGSVETFALSVAADRVALITQEEGTSVLRFLALSTGRELPRPALMLGEMSGLVWGKDNELAFTLATARAPSVVFGYDVATTKLSRWSQPTLAGSNPVALTEPKRFVWTSGNQATPATSTTHHGFLYAPDAELFPGKRPVVILPPALSENEARLLFIGRYHYLINVLGYAVVHARHDETTEQNLRAWIALQPELDASRVFVVPSAWASAQSGEVDLATFKQEIAQIEKALR
jgi:hypothetical protein